MAAVANRDRERRKGAGNASPIENYGIADVRSALLGSQFVEERFRLL